jgi:hypothetical protein
VSGLPTLEPTRHQVAIAGSVTDAQTAAAIGRARVEIEAAPDAFAGWLALLAVQYGDRWAAMDERPDRTHSAADGHFHFLDLPDGDYTLSASLPVSGTRYDTAQAEVTVSRDGEGNIAMVTADMALPPTALKGQITDQGSGDAVLMAQVRVKGSGERAFSDRDGQYLLAGLEAGERTVVISAPGYSTVSRTMQLSQGETVELDVAL